MNHELKFETEFAVDAFYMLTIQIFIKILLLIADTESWH